MKWSLYQLMSCNRRRIGLGDVSVLLSQKGEARIRYLHVQNMFFLTNLETVFLFHPLLLSIQKKHSHDMLFILGDTNSENIVSTLGTGLKTEPQKAHSAGNVDGPEHR